MFPGNIRLFSTNSFLKLLKNAIALFLLKLIARAMLVAFGCRRLRFPVRNRNPFNQSSPAALLVTQLGGIFFSNFLPYE